MTLNVSVSGCISLKRSRFLILEKKEKLGVSQIKRTKAKAVKSRLQTQFLNLPISFSGFFAFDMTIIIRECCIHSNCTMLELPFDFHILCDYIKVVSSFKLSGNV